MSFDYATAIRNRPSDAESPSAYGRFSYRESKPRGAVIPDPAWAGRNLVEVDLTKFKGFPKCGGQPSRRLYMHRIVAPVFEACMQEAADLGLLAKLHEYNGCYVPRHMGWNPTRPLSCHSWGIAVDFDASTNAYGSGLMGINRDFVRLMEERGWTWGGRWTGVYADGMHFQYTDPIPGTRLPAWQDAKLREVAPAEVKPVIVVPRKRRILLDGQPMVGTRASYGGVTITIQPDGSAYLRPSTKEEADGKITQVAQPNGVSERVTLLDKSDTWSSFAGRAVYTGLMLNLDAKTGDLWIRRATPQEINK